jgi:putative nucleotidyltransferase with HDIG domain
MVQTRSDAWDLVTEYVSSESLRKHCLCVEASMRAYARKFAEAEEFWGLCGLLHDFDYERYPEPDAALRTGHPFEGEKILRAKGYLEEVIEVILGHADYSGVPRVRLAAKCLFAVDELSGFVMAVAYLRSDKLSGLTVEAVEKKLKNKKFAERVSREDIDRGALEVGVPREEHIALVISALAGISDKLFPEQSLVEQFRN